MTQLLKNLVRAYFAVTRLQRMGCTVGQVAITSEKATVRLTAVPKNAPLPAYGFASPPGRTVRVPVLCVSHWGSTRVEWFSKERHQ